jgi:hypothetical protein
MRNEDHSGAFGWRAAADAENRAGFVACWPFLAILCRETGACPPHESAL